MRLCPRATAKSRETLADLNFCTKFSAGAAKNLSSVSMRDVEEKLMSVDIATIYDEYVSMCERLNIQPLSFATWRLLSRS
jgi:hypothetical protein